LWQQSGKTIIFVTHNVDEAIFLSDRIVLLGRRPAEVRLDIGIDLPYPRDRTCDRFNSIRREVLESLRKETFPEYAKLGYFSEGN
jgi:ABC-type nitrate/sulfonate/bicarbonate transport system ATPase subunit